MTAFAGVVSLGRAQIKPGVSKSLLSYISTPKHLEFVEFNDVEADIASKSLVTDTGSYNDDEVFVVADGRIDDSDDLCRQLGIAVSVENLGKIIGVAYKKWGEVLVDHIFGEFAFAVWNKRDKSLFLGRDRFGKMPISYMVLSDRIVFSSDFIAVAMSLSSPPEVNDSWIVAFVESAVLDHESTPFRDVKKLPPANVLTWRNGDLSIREYWSLSDVGPNLEGVDLTELVKILEHSVESRMVGSKGAAMLSGGLDSSSIAVLARDITKKRCNEELTSVSLVFEDYLEFDERPFIQSVLEQGGFDAHFVNTKEYDAISTISQLVQIQGGPYAGIGSPILDQAIAKLEQLGISSVLDGHGGDEVISSFGSMRFYELASEGKWFRLMREIYGLSRRSEVGCASTFVAYYSMKGRGPLAKLVRKLYWRWRSKNRQPESGRLLRPNWNSHPAAKATERLAKKWFVNSHQNERSYQEFVLTAPLQSDAFERIHRLYRNRGIRPEFPFWDQRLVSYCVRVTSDHKLKNGVPRSLIKSIMGERLPPKVSNRNEKFDFSDAHIHSFQSSAEKIKRFIERIDSKAFNYIDSEVFFRAVRNLHDENTDIRKDAHRKVWTTLNLILWFDLLESYQVKKSNAADVQ